MEERNRGGREGEQSVNFESTNLGPLVKLTRSSGQLPKKQHPDVITQPHSAFFVVCG